MNKLLLFMKRDGYLRLHTLMIISLCLLGAFLRLYFYVFNRSLWLDEAMLALNIVRRSIFDLFKPLDLNQGAPIGFLLMEKIVSSIFGARDYILRLIPLIGGLLSIPLIFLVSRKFGSRFYVFVSLCLFIFSSKLIYYSSELKQYSTDVLIALLLFYLGILCLEDNTNFRPIIFFGIAGSFASWFSHPAVFMVAGIYFTLALDFVIKKEFQRLIWLIGAVVVWGISFGLLYFVNLRYYTANDYLLQYWRSGFAPLPWNNINWYLNAYKNILIDPAALPVNIITAGILILGVVSFSIRRWQYVVLLLSNIPFLIIASGLEKYPIKERMILYLLPIIFLLLAEGIDRVRIELKRFNRAVSFIVAATIAVYFLYSPAIITYKNLKSPPNAENIKLAMSFIRDNLQSSDVVYVYYGAYPAFEFYAPFYNLQNKYVIGDWERDDPAKYLVEIDKLKGNNRVWIIFSHICSIGICSVNEYDYISEHLNTIGYLIDKFSNHGAIAVLYDLSKGPMQ